MVQKGSLTSVENSRPGIKSTKRPWGAETLKSGPCRSFCAAGHRDHRHVRSNLHGKSFLSRRWMRNTFAKAGGRPLRACCAGCEALPGSFVGSAAEPRSALCTATWREAVRPIWPGSPWPWTLVDARLTRGEAGSCSWQSKALILWEAWTIASNTMTWGVKMGAGGPMSWAGPPHTGMHTCRLH